MQEDISKILGEVCGFLNQANIEYVLVGGIAVMVHGRPRSTMDIDIILKLEGGERKQLVDFLTDNGFDINEKDLKNAIEESSHSTAFFQDSIFRLDIKGIYDDFDRLTLERREKISFEGAELYVATPEDTVLNKIRFGSDRDIEDAESIWFRQDNLDKRYMERISKKLGIKEEYQNFVESLNKEDTIEDFL